MIKRGFDAVAATWLAGLGVLLPLVLTAGALAWALGVVNRVLGPGSYVGGLFAAIGYSFTANPSLQYAIGTLVLIAGIYALGVIVQAGLRRPLKAMTARAVRRIPIVGGVYSLADRFVGLLDRNETADIGSMRPVWCFFGGAGAAVLALAPGAAPVDIDGRRYVAVLVPSAPVPISGALLFVPLDWVRPADIGVDTLTATYVSLGTMSPLSSAAPPPDARS